MGRVLIVSVHQGYEVTLFAADSGPTEEVGLRGISASILYTVLLVLPLLSVPIIFRSS